MTCSTNSHTQIWDPTGIHFDCDTGFPITGSWRPLTTADIKPTNQFSTSISYFSGGVTHVPTGVKAWSIGILSGAVYINNTGPIPIGTSLNGGNYGANAYLGTPIVVSGASGAYGLMMWEV